ncbi:PUA-like domain-containing protein [Trichoderma novae-zelandiae]
MTRKRTRGDGDAAAEPVAKRRSARQAAAASTNKVDEGDRVPEEKKVTPAKKRAVSGRAAETEMKSEAEGKAPTTSKKKDAGNKEMPAQRTRTKKGDGDDDDDEEETKPSSAHTNPSATTKSKSNDNNNARTSRAVSEDPDVDSIPTINPDAPRHSGEWYWLMKAEPETRLDNGVDVRFSIDDLRAKDKPEGWDGIRAYAARNHMRNMNAGDKAFFYHSNCKEPGIVGIMEVVKEFSEDKSARRPGPYHDPKSSKDNVRWNLVHVEFRKKFAVPIGLPELRELGKPGGPLENMQMLKQGRLSVSRVSKEEWEALCAIADKKAADAGLEHETGKLVK